MTRWPPVRRNAVNAEPTSPDDPVTAMVEAGQTVLGRQPMCGQIVGELAVPIDEHLAQRRRRYRRCPLGR